MRRRVMFNGRADNYIFSVEQTSISTSYASGSVTIAVTSTKNGKKQGWSISNIQNCTATNSDGSLIVSWGDNNTTSAITGNITLIQDDSGQQIIIPFSQGSASYNFSVASSSISATENNGSTSIAVTSTLGNSSVSWSVTSYTGASSATKSGNNLVVSWGNNSSSSSVSGSIKIKQSGSNTTKTISFTQSASTFTLNTTRSFSYTGSVQSSVLPAGQYKLQVWGAQGGSNAAASSYGISARTGGKGGYSEGVLTLTEQKTVYAFVGGQGGSSGNGGWNGGGGGSGSATYNASDIYGTSRMGCGGGATDIALVTSSMNYSSYRTNRNSASLLSRIIVAGGGSGGADTYREETTTNTTTTTVQTLTASNQGAVNSGNYVDGSNTIYCYRANYKRKIFTAGNKITLKGTLNSDFFYAIIVYLDENGNKITTDKFYSIGQSRTARDLVVHYIDFTRTRNTPLSSVSDCTTYFEETKTETITSTSTSSDYSPGYAGGGTNGAGYSSSYYGKQNSAGSNGGFGYGANMTTTNYRHCSACGGGGWYGGGSAYSDSSITYVRYSGGGSGFVNTSANSSYRPSGYTGLELDSGTTYAGNTSFTSTSGGTETGHSGNGYAKITRIGT